MEFVQQKDFGYVEYLLVHSFNITQNGLKNMLAYIVLNNFVFQEHPRVVYILSRRQTMDRQKYIPFRCQLMLQLRIGLQDKR